MPCLGVANIPSVHVALAQASHTDKTAMTRVAKHYPHREEPPGHGQTWHPQGMEMNFFHRKNRNT